MIWVYKISKFKAKVNSHQTAPTDYFDENNLIKTEQITHNIKHKPNLISRSYILTSEMLCVGLTK